MKFKVNFLSGVCVAGLMTVLSFQAPAETMKYVVKDHAIAKSLTGKPGDPIAGLKVVINRRQGNCLACHKMPIPDQAFHGKIGPDLAGVASRYKEGELRLRLVDARKINPDTMMPVFYSTEGLHRVAKKWVGKTVLSAQQVEDILAYLMTLREDTSFRSAYAWARKAKLKIFEWHGKVYSTGLKGK